MTRNSQGCEFPAEGAHRAASRIVSISSFGTGLSLRNPVRMLRRRLSTSRKASIDSAASGVADLSDALEGMLRVLHFYSTDPQRACSDSVDGLTTLRKSLTAQIR